MKSVKKILIMLILPLALITACKNEDVSPMQDYHQMNMYAVSNISSESATFRAEIISAGKEPILEHGFVWGLTRPFIEDKNMNVINLGTRTETGTFKTEVQYTFQENTLYRVRPFVKTETTIVYGEMVSFEVKR